MRTKPLAAAFAGVVVGGILFEAPHAAAQMGVIDVAAIAQAIKSVAAETGILDVIQAMQTVQQTMSDTMKAVNLALGKNTYGDTNTLLLDGFTQNANYAKAQVGAQQQIADANNTVMASYQKELRDAELRDEHTLSPEACVALNSGQAITVSAGQSWRVSQALGTVTDPRGEAGPGTPAYSGQGQAAAAITQLHLSRYCSENEDAAGLCTVNPARENLDQRATSLLGVPHYDGQDGVNAANDYATNLIQPIPPAASRGDALTSVAGQDAQARRRGYNARMSLAREAVNDIVASRTDSVTLTPEQKQQQAAMGLPQTDQSSWFGALELDVYRRVGGVQWAAGLQAMTPKAVEIELATELAVNNYIGLANLKVAQQNAALNAALLASAATNDLKSSPSMPSPQIASQ